jgi:hypothetical protein
MQNEIDEKTGGVDPVHCREQLGRILISRSFSKSPRLCSMLEFICTRTLESRPDDLTEQQIGIYIFGRKPGYNSAEDTIVRSTARHLRQRLDSYYSEEGRQSPVRISIPKGGYLAVFSPILPESPAEAAAEPDDPARRLRLVPLLSSGVQEVKNGWPMGAKIAVAVLLVCALLEPVLILRPRPVIEASKPIGPLALWEAIFTPGRKTLIVPGDASLDAYVAWEQHDVSLDEYTNQSYQTHVTVSRPPSATDVPIGVRSATPMADLRLVSELMRAALHLGNTQAENWIEIRFARDMVVAETHTNNLILIGPETFNPWVSLYQPQLDFNVQWNHKTDVYSVLNRAPKPGEALRYDYIRSVRHSHPMTVIALLNNSQGVGRVLLIEGTTMGATYAANNFITDERLWGPIVSAATDQTGHLRNFEVLLSSDFVRGGVTNTQVVALHLH